MFARALPGASSPIRKPQEKFGKGGHEKEEEERDRNNLTKTLNSLEGGRGMEEDKYVL